MKKIKVQCPKCGGKMKLGIALQDIPTEGVPDFPGGEVVTMSCGKYAKMIPCLKCERCGRSEYL